MNETIAVSPGGTGVFGTILSKELREGARSGLVGLAVVGMGLVFSTMFQRSVSSFGVGSQETGIPLSLFMLTSAFAAVMIGRARVIHEHRGDSWAFLIHKPVTRTMLFWGKALAGALLYIVAAGVPLLCATLWLATPGHRPAPYELRMALPGVADLLTGLVYLLAAMLAYVRDARWYGSRVLPFVAVLSCSATVVGVAEFWQAVLVIALWTAVFAIAAWGTFAAGGRYEPQRRVSRAALAIVVGFGVQLAATIVLGVLSLFVGVQSMSFDTESIAYEASGDGSFVRVASDRRMPGVSSQTARPGVISTADVPLNAGAKYGSVYHDPDYRGTNDIFVPLVDPTRRPRRVSWYYVRRLGLVAAYDNPSARLLGWMGPDGFVAGDQKPARTFEGPLDQYTEIEYMQPLLAFPGGVYRIDLEHRRIQKVFTAPQGESVVGAVSTGDSTAAMTTLGAAAQFDVIATTKRVYVQSPSGTPQFDTPRDARALGYGTLSVSRALLAPGAPTLLRYRPQNGTGSRREQRARTDQVTKISNGVVVAQYALPNEPTTASKPSSWSEVVTDGLTTPITQVAGSAALSYVRGSSPTLEPAGPRRIVSWSMSVAASLGSAVLAFAFATLCAFDPRRKALWAAIGFVFGGVGVLLMLSLIEWPTRETCPTCRAKRVVTRERCEHCGAPFAAPDSDGTEILEPGLAMA
jgi:hypothetical protein